MSRSSKTIPPLRNTSGSTASKARAGTAVQPMRKKPKRTSRRLRRHLIRFELGAKFKQYVIQNLASGSKVKPKYATPLGEGGSSVVYLASQHLHDGAEIPRAIKFFVYRDDIASKTTHRRKGPVSIRDFLSEVVNVSKFSHEHLVKVTDAGVTKKSGLDIPYLVTDFIEGPTLKEVIQAQIDPTITSKAADVKASLLREPQQLLELLISLASAIELLHKSLFAHCDIAPKNIFINAKEGAKPILGDLGVGRTIAPDISVRILGSKAYMPSFATKHLDAVIDGKTFQSIQPAWDIYSFAITALETLSILPKVDVQSWILPAKNLFSKCKEYPHSFRITDIKERLQWLRPVQRETADVPELSSSIHGRRHLLMPVQPLVASHRFKKLTIHPAVLRLAKVKQMTNAYQTFPGGEHTRYEHSLGALENMRQYLMALLDNSAFLDHLSSAKIETALLCSLFFSLARFPYDNIFREIKGDEVKLIGPLLKSSLLPRAFELKDSKNSSLLNLVTELFPKVAPDDLKTILGDHRTKFSPPDELIHSLLNNSLDVRVVDFVRRDAFHLGLAGSTLQLEELLPHLRIHNHRIALNITGISVAEEIVSLRYWLFNRVHWCNPNRAYVTMMQRLVMGLIQVQGAGFIDKLSESVFSLSDESFLKFLEDQALRSDSPDLVDLADLVNGNEPRLYKLALQLSTREEQEFGAVCDKLRNYTTSQFIALGNEIAEDCRTLLSISPGAQEKAMVLVDLPTEPGTGNKLGNDVLVINEQRQEQLSQISGIINGINTSFDTSVRKLRIFVHPAIFPVSDEARGVLKKRVKEFLLKRFG